MQTNMQLRASCPTSHPCRHPPLAFTESQNRRGWKGPLWVIWSNPPAKAGSPTAGKWPGDQRYLSLSLLQLKAASQER